MDECTTARAAAALSIALWCLSSCSGSTTETPRVTEPAAIVIDGARVWDGTGSPAIEDAVLIIKGDRIDAVGPRGAITIPAGAATIDGKGKTAIPGLINLHGHVGLTKGLVQAKENYSRENALAQLRQYARYGVTTILSLGLDDLEVISELRGAAGGGEPPRATLFTGGRGFGGKGAYPAAHFKELSGIPREVATLEEVRTEVQDLALQKPDMVKIWVDDHFGRYSKIPPELSTAIIEEAHKHGLRVMAHIFYLGDAKTLVEAGLDGLAHSVRDRELDDAFINLMKEKNAFAVSTLSREQSSYIYSEPPAFLDDPFFAGCTDPEIIKTLKDPSTGQRLKADPDFPKFEAQHKMARTNFKRLFDSGVRMAFGTDSGPPRRFHGCFEHIELELMVDAGLTPAQALQIATQGSAQALRIDADFGTLQKGKRADLLLLDANPLESILNTRKINRVWIGGSPVN